MAQPKKGQLTQFMVPLVDSTDFASVESGITESDFNSGATVRFYGVNHGVSDAFTSGTVSKAGRLVRSGVFQITLKGTENNYDVMQLRINKTGVAEAIVNWTNTDYDDSDIMSRLSDVGSDLRSYLVGLSAEISNVESQLDLVPTANLSDAVSDILALLSDLDSNFQSRVPKRVATDSQLSDVHSDLKSAIGAITVSLTASDISDIASAVAAAVGSDVSDIYSLLSDLNSNFLSRVPKAVATNSQLSDLHSDLRSYLVGISGALSDVESQLDATQANLSDFESNLLSRVPKRVATDSQLSDLASDLRSYLVGLSGAISDVESQLDLVPTVNNSDAISDVFAMLSDFYSDFQSRVPKRVATDSQLSNAHSDLRSMISGITVSLDASNISDIASAVVDAIGAGLGSDVASQVIAGLSDNFSNVQSNVNRVYSLLSDFDSDFDSRIPKEPAARSQLSDIGSDLRSVLVGLSGELSNVESQLDLVPTANLSDAVSDIFALLSDLDSNFQSRVPKAVATNSQLSELHSDLRSYLVGISGAISDVESQLDLVPTTNNSDAISNVYSLLALVASNVSDVESQIDAGIEVGASSMSDLRSAITAAGLQAAGSEPASAVGVTATYARKIDWMHAKSKNKIIQTSTVQSLRNNADSADIASASVSYDAGTSTVTQGAFGN